MDIIGFLGRFLFFFVTGIGRGIMRLISALTLICAFLGFFTGVMFIPAAFFAVIWVVLKITIWFVGCFVEAARPRR